ncbi:MAG: CocE/NonD family hydrolase [Candidatus Heimdallarchaeota archaeon]
MSFQYTFDVKVPTRDGIKLSTIIAKPAKPDNGVVYDTIVIRTPYSAKGMFGLIPSVAPQLPKPMVLLLQDTRGRYDSEGDFDLFNEANDTIDTLNWVVEQSWSNGLVHFFGPSYLGYTALQVLQKESKATIKSVFSPMTFTSAVDEAIYSKSGVMNLHHGFPFSIMTSTRVQANLGSINGTWPEVYRTAFPAGPKAVGWPNKIWDTFRNKEELRKWTIHFNPDPDFGIKATFIASYNDFLCTAGITAFEKISAIGGVQPSLKIGPWGHNGYLTSLDHVGTFSISDAGKGNLIADLTRHFETVQRPEEQDVSVFILRKDEWRFFDAWPLPTDARQLHLHADGSLAKLPATTSELTTIEADINNPVETLGGPVWEGPTKNLQPGPIDQRPVNQREDIRKFASNPLDQNVTIMGSLSVSIRAGASLANSHLTAKLYVITNEGEELIIQEGVALLATEELQSYTVDMGFTAIEIKTGERLMLELSWSNFPRFELANHLQNHTISFQIDSHSALNYGIIE